MQHRTQCAYTVSAAAAKATATPAASVKIGKGKQTVTGVFVRTRKRRSSPLPLGFQSAVHGVKLFRPFPITNTTFASGPLPSHNEEHRKKARKKQQQPSNWERGREANKEMVLCISTVNSFPRLHSSTTHHLRRTRMRVCVCGCR